MNLGLGYSLSNRINDILRTFMCVITGSSKLLCSDDEFFVCVMAYQNDIYASQHRNLKQ